MAQDILDDSEMQKLESSMKTGPIGPDVLSDEEMNRFESQPGNIPSFNKFVSGALGQAGQMFLPSDTPFKTPPILETNMANPFHFVNTLRGVTGAGLNRMMDTQNIQNPIERFATELPANIIGDPFTYLGAFKGVQKTPSVFKKVFPYTSPESRVAFTKDVENALINRRAALTRAYTNALNRSKGVVDISDIVEPGSEITKLTMKEAQDLKNAINQGVPDAVKSGIRISPKHFMNRYTAGKITEKMKSADESMKPIIEKYGTHAENFKSAIAPIRSSKGPENIFGSNLIKQMFGAGGQIPERSKVALKEFAPRIAKDISNAKINENIFRTLRGSALTGLGYNLVPNPAKRAFVSSVTGD